MVKRLLAFGLAVCMVLGLLPGSLIPAAQATGLQLQRIDTDEAVKPGIGSVDAMSEGYTLRPEDRAELMASDASNPVYVEGDVLYSLSFEALELINADRVANGVSELVMNTALLNTAVQRSAEQPVYYGNTRPNGESCFTAFPTYTVSVNIRERAMGNMTPQRVAEKMLEQLSTYAQFRSVGIGCFRHDGVLFWVLDFCTASSTSMTSVPADETRLMKIPLGQEYYDGGIYGETSMDIGDTQPLQMYLDNPEWEGIRAYLDVDHTSFTSTDPQIASVTGHTVTAVSVGEVELQASSANQNAAMTLLVRQDDCVHQWGAGETTVLTTCTSSGEYTYSCILCGQIQRDVLPPWEHYYVDDRCTNCGDNIREDGTELYPYKIETAADFASIAAAPDQCYKLMTDLVLNDGSRIGSFSGVLDGNGHTVRLTGSEALIHTLEDSAQVKNLTLDVKLELDQTGDYLAAAVCLYNNGLIENCVVNGGFDDEWSGSVLQQVVVGGICANNYGTITKCKNDADFELQGDALQGLQIGGTPAYIGGIAGVNYGRVDTCWNDGYITVYLSDSSAATADAAGYIGGVVGIGHAVNCATGADLDVRMYSNYVRLPIYAGYVYGEEFYARSSYVYTGASGNRNMVSQNSALEFNYVASGYPNESQAEISETVHKSVTNQEIEQWWKQRNDPVPEPEGFVRTSVQYLSSWDEETQIVGLGTGSTTLFQQGSGARVTERTDPYFLAHVDELLDTFCLVSTKSHTDGRVGPSELLSVIPVETKVGTVTHLEDGYIYIDQVPYSYDSELVSWINWYDECYVRYHLLNGKIVGIWMLTKPSDSEVISKINDTDQAAMVIRPNALDSWLADKWMADDSTVVELHTVNDDNIGFLEDGFAIPYADALAGSVTLSREGYRDYIIPARVSEGLPRDISLIERYTVSAYLQQDTQDGLPYISTVFIRGSSTRGFVDARRVKTNIQEDETYTIVMTAVGFEGQAVTYYLAQSDEKLVSSEDGLFVSTLFEHFDYSNDFYVYAVAADGTMTKPERVKIEKEVEMDSDTSALMNDETLNLLSKAGPTGFKISDEIPLLGGLEMSLKDFDVPIGISMDGPNVRISIGLDIFSYEDNEMENEDDDKEPDEDEEEIIDKEDKYNWTKREYEKNEVEKEKQELNFNLLKEMVEQLKPSTLAEDVAEDLVDMEDILKFYDTCKEKFPGSVRELYKSKNKSFNVGAFGYIEGVILDGKLVFKEYRIGIEGNAMYRYTQQGAIWAVPAYFYIEGNGELEVQFGHEAPKLGSDLPLDFGIILEADPGAAVGAGIGIEGAVSAGVRGSANLPYENNFSKKHHKLMLEASFDVEAQFFLLEGRKTLLQTEKPMTLFDTDYGKEKSSYSLYSTDVALETVIDVVSRDYAKDTSRWLGGAQTAESMGVEDAANAGVSFRNLQTSVFDRSQPQLVTVNDRMLMVWVEDAAGRDDYNRMRLVYSLHDSATNTWSDRRPVFDDGHNDAYPALVSDGTNAYVAWQKIDRTLTAEDCDSLDATLENSEICLARFDPLTGTFTDARILTDNQVYDYAPAVALSNGEPLVYYISSSNNDLQAAGANTLMCWDAAGSSRILRRELNYVLGTEALDGGVALVMDTDGDALTTEDINVCVYDGKTITPLDKDGTDMALSMMTQAQWEGVQTLFVSNGVNIYAVRDGRIEPILDSERQIGGNLNASVFDDGVMLLWTEEHGGSSEIYALTFGEDGWTKPVRISEQGTLLTGMDTVSWNGKVFGVCNSSETAYDEALKSYETLQTDLCVFETRDFSDLVLDSTITLAESEAVPGSNAPILVRVENDGTVAIEQAEFTITDTLGTAVTTTVELGLLPGDSRTVTLEYPVPANYGAATLTVSAEQGVTDIDPDNNSASLEIGHTDLSVRQGRLSNADSVYILEAVVDNVSGIDAEHVTLELRLNDPQSEAIQVDEIGSIPAGSYATVQLRLDEQLLTFEEDEAAKMYLTAVTGSDEQNPSNNTTCFVVAPIEPGLCAHAITREIPALEPSCVAEGFTAGQVCDICDAVLVPSETVEPLGHEFRYQVTVEPTMVDCGVLTGRCQQCFCQDVQILPALSEYSYIRELVQQATAVEAGIARYTWRVTDYGTYVFYVEVHETAAESSVVDLYGIRFYSMAYELLELTNAARAEQGAAPLTMTQDLLETAMQRSQELAVYYSHTRPDGSEWYNAFPEDAYGVLSENIHFGSTDAEGAITSLINSPGHYANIIDEEVTAIGIGCFYHNGGVYWTQCFAGTAGTACTQPSDVYFTAPVDLGTVRYELLINGEAEMAVGDSQELLTGIFNPVLSSECAIFENDSVTWYSGDPSVASVEDGVVTANGTGMVTIWAYAGVNTASFTVEVVPAPVKEVASGWSGYTQWSLTDDGVLTFSGEGAMKNYTYKSEMPWYSYADQITSVVIGEGVTSIGSYAFYGMGIESISIPESVTTIGDYAFKNAPKIDNVVLPEGLTSLGDSAFYACTSLTSIEIPASLWTIKPYTFKNCTALAEVTFNEGNLQKISDGAFYGTALTELVLPDCLDILDVYSFKNCTELASITIGEGLTELREAVFYGTAIPTITIPEGITKIGPYAFKNCVELETIDLPSTLTSVGEAAFYADTALTTVELPDSVTSIGNYAFRKCAAIETLKLSAELVTVGECAFYGCTGLTELVIPDKVTTIKPYAFKTCEGLTSVVLGASVKTIGEGAFNTCTGLKTIVFPASVTSIGDYCFSGSTSLWKLTFQGDAPAIGTGAFKGMDAYAYYPAGNATYTSANMLNYGGKITWTAK